MSARVTSKDLPWNALLALGRRSGYLLPYDDRGRGGKEHKRYGVNAEFAEVLVAATVAPGDPVDFDDFLDDSRDVVRDRRGAQPPTSRSSAATTCGPVANWADRCR